MKALVISIALLFAAGCATQHMSTDQPVSTGDIVRYMCYTYADSKHVLTLPIPETDADPPLVDIIFQGNFLPAI